MVKCVRLESSGLANRNRSPSVENSNKIFVPSICGCHSSRVLSVECCVNSFRMEKATNKIHLNDVVVVVKALRLICAVVRFGRNDEIRTKENLHETFIKANEVNTHTHAHMATERNILPVGQSCNLWIICVRLSFI